MRAERSVAIWLLVEAQLRLWKAPSLAPGTRAHGPSRCLLGPEPPCAGGHEGSLPTRTPGRDSHSGAAASVGAA